MPEFDETTGYRMGGSEFYGHGNAAPKYASPAKDAKTPKHEHPHKEEEVKNTIAGTKEDPTWTKSKGGKSSTYTVDKKYTKESGGKGKKWVNKEGGSFISAS